MKSAYILIVLVFLTPLAFSSPASDVDTGFKVDVIKVVHSISDHALGGLEQIK